MSKTLVQTQNKTHYNLSKSFELNPIFAIINFIWFNTTGLTHVDSATSLALYSSPDRNNWSVEIRSARAHR